LPRIHGIGDERQVLRLEVAGADDEVDLAEPFARGR
jgi:hypothetical protein